MDKWVLIRRAVHILIAFTPLYYLVPDPLPYLECQRTIILVVGAALVSAIEISRFAFGLRLPGLRDYEERRIASYVWAAAGVLLALLFFPRDIASASIIGMALADPIAGELRNIVREEWVLIAVPTAACFCLCMAVYLLFDLRPLPVMFLLSAVGATVSVYIERWKNASLDDDLLMIVVPGALATCITWIV